jgi:[protein-PII] uridylyltransferase
MVPEFSPVVGRVHHDTYHVYTVDVHSVAAVDRLCEIVRGDIVVDDKQEDRWVGSLACRLASEVERRKVLFFATLLHDVGKAIGRRDHSERGAEMARVIGARLRFTDDEIERVARLVTHHLTMYHMATRRDLDDPATSEELAQVVRDGEGLRDLYLLTVADLSTTSPTSMTSWKARMLDELYVATERLFSTSPTA